MDPNNDNSGSWSDALTSLISTAGGAFNSYEYSQATQSGNVPVLYGNRQPVYGNPGFSTGVSGSTSILWIALLGFVGLFAFMRMK